MKQLLYTYIIIISALSFTACSKENLSIRASGNMVSKNIDLSTFSGIDLRLPADVEIIQSNEFKIEMQARENIINLIRTQIINGNLQLDISGWNIKGRNEMHFKIYTSDLAFLRVAGSGSIQSQAMFPQRDWKLFIDGSGNINANVNGIKTDARVSGSGNINMHGTTTELQTNISGSGNIYAFNLPAEKLDATISGSGIIETNVSKTLSATISGSGNIYYKGQPNITQVSISGSGKIINRN